MSITRRQFLALAGMACTASCATINPFKRKNGKDAEPAPGGFSVALLNDLHMTDARSAAFLNRAVQRISAIPRLRCCFVLGDIASAARLQEFRLAKGALGRLPVPYCAIPGNHDVAPGAKAPYSNFIQTFGDTSWVREEDKWVFIGLDSCEGGSSDVTIPQDRLDWLARRLKHINEKHPIALLTHHPLNPHTKNYRVKNAGDVLALFQNHNLRLAAAGHYHGNQEEVDAGIMYMTTACCSCTRDNFDGTTAKGFRLLHFQDHEFTVEFVETT